MEYLQGRPPRGSRFYTGQCVTHVDQPLPSTVLWQAGSGEREMCGLASRTIGDPIEERIVMADGLRAIQDGDPDCVHCALYLTTGCLRWAAAV